MKKGELLPYRAVQAAEWIHRKQRLADMFYFDARSLKTLVQFGPKYRAWTSRGEPMDIFTMSNNFVNRCDMLLLSFDWQQTLTGIRQTVARREEASITARGSIYTAQRQRGHAVPLELAHMDLLQRLANYRQVPITYTVENDNKAQLEEIKAGMYESLIEEHISGLVAAKTAEQQRWQALYGKNGLLGYSEKGTLTFRPQRIPRRPRFDQYAYVTLFRQQIGNRIFPVVFHEEIHRNARKLRNQRVKELETVVLPAIASSEEQVDLTESLIATIHSALTKL